MNVENFSLNIELFYLINHTRHPLLDEFFRYFYVFGKGYILIPIVLYLAFLKREKLKPFILALALESALVHILKFAFKAPRPASMLKDVYLLEPLYHKSFPSGDTAMAFLLACFFSQGASTPIKILPFVSYTLARVFVLPEQFMFLVFFYGTFPNTSTQGASFKSM